VNLPQTDWQAHDGANPMVDQSRRKFMSLLGGAFASCSGTALAQQGRMHRIGGLLLGNADAQSFRTELREALRNSGFIEGQNVFFDIRSAAGRLDALPVLAAELVAAKVEVIVALFTPCALAAQKATRDIPIVAIAANPVEMGLVSSLAHPGANITGISLMASESHGKCVELFRDMLPSVRRVAALGNGADPSWQQIFDQVQAAGRLTGIEIAPAIVVRGPDEIDAAFARMKAEQAGGVVVQGSFSNSAVIELALKHGLPAASVPRAFAEIGGLMSYGASGPETFRRSASFVIKLLRGGKPADMPVEQPTKFELVVNLKTAKALGLTIAESFLLRADQVIE
jgi:putative tryptophan/tyrosine transport system substrate-binding protein